MGQEAEAAKGSAQDFELHLSHTAGYDTEILGGPMGQIDHPVAVDPDEKLRQHALDLGWPVISLRGGRDA